MSPRLSRGEYWILTQLAQHGLPFNVLGLPESPSPEMRSTLGEALNCRGHGLEPDSLARLLSSMARHGWIEFIAAPLGSRAAPPRTAHTHVRAALTRSGLFSESPYACLTPKGGETWERFARPEWQYFVDDFCEYDDALPEGWRRREVTAAEPRMLRRYLEALRREETIAPGSERYVEIEAWEMAYWKPRQRGFRWTAVAREPQSPSGPSSAQLRQRWCDWR